MLTPSKNCIDLIKKFEGCKLKAYLCPAKVWTIGFGATGADIKSGVVWTQAQADARLKSDVERFAIGVRAAIGKAKTTQGQYDALVSFSYNLGFGALKTSTLLRLHLAGDFKGARLELAKWVKAGGKTLPGLVTRREAEAALYAS